jgi:hypothetical protein
MRLRTRFLLSFSFVVSTLCAGAAGAAGANAAADDAPPPDTRPVRVAGLWCGTGLLHEYRFELSQQDEAVHGNLMRRDRARVVEGRLDGSTLRTQSTRIGSLVMELAGDELRVTGGDGPLSLLRGAKFLRATSSGCAG